MNWCIFLLMTISIIASFIYYIKGDLRNMIYFAFLSTLLLILLVS